MLSAQRDTREFWFIYNWPRNLKIVFRFEIILWVFCFELSLRLIGRIMMVFNLNLSAEFCMWSLVKPKEEVHIFFANEANKLLKRNLLSDRFNNKLFKFEEHIDWSLTFMEQQLTLIESWKETRVVVSLV